MEWDIRSNPTRTLKLIALFVLLGLVVGFLGTRANNASASNARWLTAFFFGGTYAGVLFLERVRTTVDEQHQRLRQERAHWWGATDVKSVLFREVEAVRVFEERRSTGDRAVTGYYLSLDLVAGGLLRTRYFTTSERDIDALAQRLARAIGCPVTRGGTIRSPQRLVALVAATVAGLGAADGLHLALGGVLHAPTMWAEPSGPYVALTVFAGVLSAIEWKFHL
jgi:hypothetical protein